MKKKCAKYLLHVVNSRNKNIFYFNELYFRTIQTGSNGDLQSIYTIRTLRTALNRIKKFFKGY